MPTYIPDYKPTLNFPCPVHLPASKVDTDPLTQVLTFPHAPRVWPVPLLPLDSITVARYQPTTDLYPISIFASLTNAQQIALQSIHLGSPVHVHTPTAHIGTIYGSSTSIQDQHTTALDVFLFLQSLATNPLGLYTTFSGLSLELKTRVRAEFYQRAAMSTDICDVAWEGFVSGQHTVGCPLGVDLLLGNTQVWGFESHSLGGYSVIHITSSA